MKYEHLSEPIGKRPAEREGVSYVQGTQTSRRRQQSVVILTESERVIPLLPWIEALSNQGFRVLVYFAGRVKDVDGEVHSMHRHREKLQQMSNVEVRYHSDRRGHPLNWLRARFYRPKKPLFRLFMWSKHTSVGQRLFERHFRSVVDLYYEHAKGCFRDSNTIALITITDKNINLGQPGFIKAARELNIPVVLPHLHYRDPTTRTLRGNNKYRFHASMSGYQRRVFNEFADSRFGNQIFEGYFFYQAYCLVVLEENRLLSPNPWMIGAGPSTDVIVDHRYTIRRYEDSGTPADKMRILGDLAFDPLFEAYQGRGECRKRIIEKYRLSPDHKLVLIALPPLYEHLILSEDEHWVEIRFIMDEAVRSGENLMVSLHPKMDREAYTWLEHQYGCCILDEPLNTVLPVADLFITSLSTTILWSVMCGVRPIMIDFYDFKSTMYDFLNSVAHIENKDEFYPAIARFLSAAGDFSEDWATLGRDQMFDGRALERHVELIKSLSLEKP